MSFNILQVSTPAQVQQVRLLMRAYVETGLVDLSSQNIDVEIAELPGVYHPPTGALFLATNFDGKAIGCAAVHRLGETDDAELKRLFVEPNYRCLGIAKSLIKATLDTAREMRCKRLVLDTMPAMTAAIAIYEALGFQKIDPYWDNVLPVIFYGKSL